MAAKRGVGLGAAHAGGSHGCHSVFRTIKTRGLNHVSYFKNKSNGIIYILKINNVFISNVIGWRIHETMGECIINQTEQATTATTGSKRRN
jgi:hypothetical protein